MIVDLTSQISNKATDFLLNIINTLVQIIFNHDTIIHAIGENYVQSGTSQHSILVNI